MVPYQATQVRPAMGRAVAVPLGQGAPTGAQAAVPPPGPDPIFTGYMGIPGWIEAVLVLSVTGAAAFVGIKTGMGKANMTLKAAGWVGGVGSALVGLLYLGAKSGLGNAIGLPAVRVTPY